MSLTTILLILSGLANLALVIACCWYADRLEVARSEHRRQLAARVDEIARLRAHLDDAMEFGRDCLAQSKRMGMHVIGAQKPRIEGA